MQKRIQTEMLSEYVRLLEEVKKLTQEGKPDKGEELLNTELANLKKKIEKFRVSDSNKENAGITMLISLERQELIYKDAYISLVPITTEALAEEYFKVRLENADFPSLYGDEEGKKGEIKEVLEDRTFYCGIFSQKSGAFIGYCGINNIYSKELEIAVAVLKKYQRNGYGFQSLNALMKTLNKETGISHFISKIDPENKASRQLMLKLGFKPAGIDTFLIDDEEKLRVLEEENLEYLTEDLEILAGEFNVEPRKLLSHVLVYSIDL